MKESGSFLNHIFNLFSLTVIVYVHCTGALNKIFVQCPYISKKVVNDYPIPLADFSQSKSE